MDFVPSLPTLIAFAAASLLLAATPGPDMTLAISRALAQGKKAGLFVVVGTGLGFAVHTLLVAFGISVLITASPTAFLVLKTGGAAYILWLAIQAIRYGSSLSVAKVTEAKGSALSNIATGFSVNILNPKVVIFFMTFLPQFVSADDPAVTGNLLFLGFSHVVIGVPVNALVVFAADWLAAWLQRNRRFMRAIDYSFAGVFSALAVKIFLTQAQ